MNIPVYIMDRMDIYGAIKKATEIPKTNGDVSFVRLRNPDQATLDRNMNRRRFKTPRNIKLLEEDDCHADESYSWNTSYSLNENEISSSIKAVNGGVSYSNKAYEDRWKLKQADNNSNIGHFNASTSSANLSSDSSTVTETSNVQKTKQNESKENTENHEESNSIYEVLKECKLSKNALIVGLLNNHKIAIEDLQIPKKPNLQNEKSHNQSDLQTNDIAIGEYLLQHPDEPDVYIHPLQMPKRLGILKGGAADFIVQHVGVKKTITPRQYYITENGDTSFEFVKRNVKDK